MRTVAPSPCIACAAVCIYLPYANITSRRHSNLPPRRADSNKRGITWYAQRAVALPPSAALVISTTAVHCVPASSRVLRFGHSTAVSYRGDVMMLSMAVGRFWFNARARARGGGADIILCTSFLTRFAVDMLGHSVLHLYLAYKTERRALARYNNTALRGARSNLLHLSAWHSSLRSLLFHGYPSLNIYYIHPPGSPLLYSCGGAAPYLAACIRARAAWFGLWRRVLPASCARFRSS